MRASTLIDAYKTADANHLLVEIHLAEPLYLTDAPVTIIHDGNTYQPSGHLLDAGDITSTREISVDDIDLELSVVDLQLLPLLANDYQNRAVVIHRALLQTDYTVVAVDAVIWAGRINNFADKETADSHTLTLNLTNEMATFNEPAGRQLTSDAQQQVYPADTGLRHALVADAPQGEWGHEDLAQGGGMFAEKIRMPGIAVDLNVDTTAQKLPLVFGRTAVKPSTVYRHITGQDNRYLCLIDAICVGNIDAIEAVEVAGYDIDSAEGIARFGIGQSGNGKPYIAHVDRLLGQSSHSAYPWLLNYPAGVNRPGSTRYPDFLASDTFEGMASQLLVLRNHIDGPYAGEPDRRYIVRGARVWDPRDPAQRSDDPSTWRWSNNFALCILHFLRLPKAQGGWGRSVDQLILDDFITEADWIDATTVTGSDGQPRPVMTCNVALPTSKTRVDNLRTLLDGCRGRRRYVGGKMGFAIERARASVMALDEDDLHEIEFASPEIDDRKNRITVEFTDAANGWVTNTATWPQESDPEFQAYLEADLWEEQTDKVKLPTIDNWDEALQMAEVLCRRSRSKFALDSELPPYCAVLEAGDVAAVSDGDRGWDARAFVLDEVVVSSDMGVSATLYLHDPSIYVWRDKPLPPPGPTYPKRVSTTVPMVTGIAYAPPTDLQPQGRITWEHDDDYGWTGHYIITVTKEGAPEASGTSPDGDYPVPPLDAGAYLVEVVRVSTLGKSSDPATISFELVEPAAPTGAQVEAESSAITIRPQVAKLGLGTTFEFWWNDADALGGATLLGVAPMLTKQGLAADAPYWCWVYTRTTLGRSGKPLKLALRTTLLDSDVLEHIDSALEEKLADATEEVLEAIPGLADAPLGQAENFLEVVKQATNNEKAVIQQKTQEHINDDHQSRIEQSETAIVQHGDSIAAAQHQLTVVADEQQALAESQTQMAVEYDQKIAGINSTTTALANADQALAQKQTTLEAAIDDAEALVWQRERAMVGYCPTGQHTSPEQCAAAGHSWVQAKPFADSVRMVGVVTEDGRTLSLQSYMQALEDEQGELKAKAFLGVDAQGRISGIAINASSSYTSMDFIADAISFSAPDDPTKKLLYWDAVNNHLVFRGKFTLDDGTVVGDGDLVGPPGPSGSDGQSGPGIWALANDTGVFGTTSVVNALFESAFGRAPIKYDVLTLYKSTDPKVGELRQYNGVSWVQQAATIHGSAIVSGSLTGDVLIAGSEIVSPRIKGGRIEIGPYGQPPLFVVEENGNFTAKSGRLENVVIDKTCTAEHLVIKGQALVVRVSGEASGAVALAADNASAATSVLTRTMHYPAAPDVNSALSISFSCQLTGSLDQTGNTALPYVTDITCEVWLNDALQKSIALQVPHSRSSYVEPGEVDENVQRLTLGGGVHLSTFVTPVKGDNKVSIRLKGAMLKSTSSTRYPITTGYRSVILDGGLAG